MNYVCHHPYDGPTLDNTGVFIKRGEPLDRQGAMLYYQGHPVCVWRSLNGKKHFALDTDGKGLERGDLTYALAYAPRNDPWTPRGPRQRFTDAEIRVLLVCYEQYLKKGCDVVMFNDMFFEESPENLRRLAKSLDMDV